jgi:hypothetical protein
VENAVAGLTNPPRLRELLAAFGNLATRPKRCSSTVAMFDAG